MGEKGKEEMQGQLTPTAFQKTTWKPTTAEAS